jgi:hypothetical protein
MLCQHAHVEPSPSHSFALTALVAQRIVCLLERLLTRALVEDFGLTEEVAAERLRRELAYYRDLRLEDHSLNQVFGRSVLSLANRKMLYNVLLGGPELCEAVFSAYQELLFDFDPARVFAAYQARRELLLARLVQARGLQGAQAERQLTHPRSLFRLYTRGIVAGAACFAQFADGADFARMVRGQIAAGREAAIGLPCKFRFPGLSYALAADLLKEVGVREVGKPDVHVRRCLAAIGWAGQYASDLAVQEVFWNAWQVLGDGYPPVTLDKLFFLVGSGRFEMVAPAYKCRPRFAEFVRGLDLLGRERDAQRPPSPLAG